MPKVKAGDLYLGSAVHVMRGSKDKPEMHIVQAGQFVSETDLKADEIEDLKRHGVLRVGSLAEIEAAESREDNKSAAEAIRENEQEQRDLASNQKLEKDKLAAEQAAETQEKERKLAEQQAAERDKVAAKASKPVGSGTKKK